jgi:hypothetical protein
MELCKLMDESARNELLQSSYIRKAQIAYSDEDYKLCTIFMRQTELKNSVDISMLVSSVYKFWTSNTGNNLQRGPLTSRAVILEFVQLSISPLFETGSGRSSYLLSTDYLKLIHIYICCGSLISSLQTIRSAMILKPSDNHLRIQEWAVLKAMSDDEGADVAIESLSSALASEISCDTNENENETSVNVKKENLESHLQILHIHLFCLLHLQRKGDEISFNNLLNKAYNLSDQESYLTAIVSHRKIVLEQQLEDYNIQQKYINEQQEKEICTENNNEISINLSHQEPLLWTDSDNEELLTILSCIELDREKQVKWLNDSTLWLAMAAILKVYI